MKRTLPQKVKLVPSCVTQTEVEAGQIKQNLPEVNRRVRTSAAMLGLALSMGAHSLLMPRAGDSAIAAEPVPGEAAAPAPADFAVATLSPEVKVAAPESASSSNLTTIEHTVQEGQTMLRLAQLYGVDAVTIANANGIAVNSVLQVGQVLKVPTSSQIARSPQPTTQADSVGSIAPEYYGPIVSTNDADAALKAEQDTALSQLQEKRDSLRDSLAKLKAAKAEVVAEKATQSVAQAAPEIESVPVIAQSTVAPTNESAANAAPKLAVAPDQQATPATSASVPADQSAKSEVQPEQSTTVATVIDLPQVAQPAAESAPLSAKSSSYRITAGDTLSAIARAHGITQQQLIEANQIQDPNLIRADQVLIIPKSIAMSVATDSYKVASTAVVSSASTLPAVPTSKAAANPRFQTGSIATLPIQPQPTAASVATPTASPDVAVSVTPALQQPSRERLEASVSSVRADYVEGLRQEIVKLREKYQVTPVTAKVEAGEVTKLAATSTLSTPVVPNRVNPEFSAQGDAVPVGTKAALRSQASVKASRATELAPAASRSKPQKVATASIGAPNYAPLIPAVGQMVSPDLPPLGSGDAYLPKGSGQFAGYIWPAKGMLTSGYGWRWGRMHKGIDIAAPVGTPVVAAAPGVVTYAGWNSGGYGNLVEVTHPDGSVTLYAHNDRILVREGQDVDQGQQLAEMGSTGYSTGPHSHFEVHLPGQGAVNPMAYLSGGGA